MNYNSPTHPLNQTNELFYQIFSPPNSDHQQQTIQQQHNQDKMSTHDRFNPCHFQVLSDDHLLPPNISNNLEDNNKYKTALFNTSQESSYPNKDGYGQNDKKNKMILRRDIEKQRRQEMSRLFASIRSLLPIEYIKGKRSTSDHMFEATKYIKNLQNKIQDMKHKRDGLKKRSIMLSNDPYNINRSAGNTSSHESDFVTVQPCSSGLEIVINTSFINDNNGVLPLSGVFQVLLEEGLNVVSCVSTRVNERSVLHTIQVEVSNVVRGMSSTSELEWKLMDLVQNCSSN